MNHFLPVKLKNWGKNSYVFWSKTPTEGAIIFIHGFGGSAAGTFKNFNKYIATLPRFRNFDVYFYGYDSLFTQTNNSSLSFYDFLEYIHNSKQQLFNSFFESENRDEPFSYKKTTIIAHSLGAVIARLSLLIAHKAKSQWHQKTDLILFAPAHTGAQNSFSAIMDCGNSLIGLVGALASHFVVTFSELQEGSKVLEYLLNESTQLTRREKPSFAVAKNVLWADKERIVKNTYFLKDPRPKILKDTNHISVCKPKNHMDEMIKEVIDFL